MKQMNPSHKKKTVLKALLSSSLIALFIYAVLRSLFFEFPMTWSEEISFFLKTFFTGFLIIAAATIGSAWLYRGISKMKKA